MTMLRLIRFVPVYSLQSISKALPPIANIKNCRYIFTTNSNFVRDIKVTTVNNVTTVEGFRKDSDRKGSLLPESKKDEDLCCLCPSKLGFSIKYTDVLVISQFLTPEGHILPRGITGLCAKAYSRLEKLVYQARRARLIPEPPEEVPLGKSEPELRSWRTYNAFYADT